MDLLEVIEKRRSIRKFKPAPIKKGDLKKILEAARLAPSACNYQPWRFVVVKASKTKRALALASDNQRFIADAHIVIVALGDSQLYKKLAPTTLHKQDTMTAVEHMVLAATALGYGTCWIGAFNEEKIKKTLQVPRKLDVVALLPVGVPDENPKPRPRKAFKEIFFKETYGKPLEL